MHFFYHPSKVYRRLLGHPIYSGFRESPKNNLGRYSSRALGLDLLLHLILYEISHSGRRHNTRTHICCASWLWMCYICYICEGVASLFGRSLWLISRFSATAVHAAVVHRVDRGKYYHARTQTTFQKTELARGWNPCVAVCAITTIN